MAVFPARRLPRWITIGLGILAAVLVAGVHFLILPGALVGSRLGKESSTKALCSSLVMACSSYNQEYGALPANNENRILAQVLSGQSLTGMNSRRIAFIEFYPRNLSQTGEIVDDWETPLKIEFTENQIITVSSAGSDRTWETNDDLIERSIAPIPSQSSAVP